MMILHFDGKIIYCCFIIRDELKMLITRLNEEKKQIKEEGLLVDGKWYRITFKGIGRTPYVHAWFTDNDV